MITRDRLIELTEYDHITGQFHWKKRITREGDDPAKVAAWNTRYSGNAAGVKTHGYLKISIDDNKYYAHRLVWLFMNGTMPDGLIDHINRNGLDNRYQNLRIANKRENSLNTDKIPKNKTGFTGVVALPHGRFSAQKTISGVHYYLGSYDTPQEAHQAWKAR